MRRLVSSPPVAAGTCSDEPGCKIMCQIATSLSGSLAQLPETWEPIRFSRSLDLEWLPVWRRCLCANASIFSCPYSNRRAFLGVHDSTKFQQKIKLLFVVLLTFQCFLPNAWQKSDQPFCFWPASWAKLQSGWENQFFFLGKPWLLWNSVCVFSLSSCIRGNISPWTMPLPAVIHCRSPAPNCKFEMVGKRRDSNRRRNDQRSFVNRNDRLTQPS